MAQTRQSRKPRYQRAGGVKLRIQDRDLKIIHYVYQHRFLTSRHLTALVPGHPKDILRRLYGLYHAGYLDRPRQQVKPFQPGSQPMVYALGNKGADLLTSEFGLHRGRVDWTAKNREVKRVYLEHTLMVSGFMVSLELACRQ
ncbi:MAG: replication-relaxation family protein, partial [Deltaproteobacteria bacterium]|nr:replication-relaxation family protein [Deltaproteobacteria bacterium]